MLSDNIRLPNGTQVSFVAGKDSPIRSGIVTARIEKHDVGAVYKVLLDTLDSKEYVTLDVPGKAILEKGLSFECCRA
jgi:hypothetical protein